MSAVIKLKRTALSGKIPTSADIVAGELAVNMADGKLYTKDDNNNIVNLSGADELHTHQMSQVEGLNTELSKKADIAGVVFTGKVGTKASATTGAGINLPHGVAPTAPVNGDMWTTTSALFVRLNGTTRQLAHTSSWSAMSQAVVEAGTNTSSYLVTALRLRQGTVAHLASGVIPKAIINTVDDGLNSLQVANGIRTDTLSAGNVQDAEESIETDGNIKVRNEGKLIMGDFTIQFNSITKSLDFNFIGV